MLQRIQTLYFLIIVIILVLLIFIPIGELEVAGSNFQLMASGMFAGEGVSSISLMPLVIYNSLLAVYTLIIIFLYGNRPMQIKLARLNGILLAVLIALVVLSADYVTDNFDVTEDEVLVNYGIGTYLTFIPLILNYLAIKRIRKDEELVRSADRMR